MNEFSKILTKKQLKNMFAYFGKETEEKHKHKRGEIELFPYLFFQPRKYKNKTENEKKNHWRDLAT